MKDNHNIEAEQLSHISGGNSISGNESMSVLQKQKLEMSINDLFKDMDTINSQPECTD